MKLSLFTTSKMQMETEEAASEHLQDISTLM